ncbi:MAG: bifunctional folylpolyglutamate synthase/dihydrofolate synthase [Cytophagales bacterium]|nr:bifunctional folylpolyglutamate synthase/dihydrofolate synthase [Cytophagales bacterium]
MNYAETVDYLYRNLPMYQRIGATAFKNDLTNTIALCNALGNPHTKFKSVHVAGTNGKGSTSHMLAAILQTAGYKTALYTSPHLKDFTERIRINGLAVSRQFVIDFVERIKPHIESIKPSFFEITVAMAFDYFAQSNVELAVIEVGLGGRLDSTNVITPVLSLITNISWDHMEILGETLSKIAAEKAGIIKPYVPVIVSETQAGVEPVFRATAHATNSTIIFADQYYKVAKTNDRFNVVAGTGQLQLKCDLQGQYQTKNIAGVLAAVDQLRAQGFSISAAHVQNGLQHAGRLTGLKGRWQKLNDNPLTICDTAHNEAGIKEILNQLHTVNFSQLHWVWGMVKDKDVRKILNLLPADAHYYFCQANIPRAMDATTLAQHANAVGLKGEIIPDVNEAIRTANRHAQHNDLVLIGGSTFVVAEIENL